MRVPRANFHYAMHSEESINRHNCDFQLSCLNWYINSHCRPGVKSCAHRLIDLNRIHANPGALFPVANDAIRANARRYSLFR